MNWMKFDKIYRGAGYYMLSLLNHQKGSKLPRALYPWDPVEYIDTITVCENAQ